MKTIPSIKLPIIQNGEISNEVLSDIMANKKEYIYLYRCVVFGLYEGEVQIPPHMMRSPLNRRYQS